LLDHRAEPVSDVVASSSTARAPDPFSLHSWERGDTAIAAQILEAATELDGRPNPGTSWFDWKMGASPWGQATVIRAVDRESGSIAGVVAFGTWRFLHRGNPVNGALSYETFVLPRYQRRGLFQRLCATALDELRHRGIDLVVNFPNKASLPGFLRLRFQSMGGFETWLRPRTVATGIRYAARMVRGDRTPTAIPVDLQAVSERWIEGAAELASLMPRFPVPWCSARDAAILRWRYATRPTWAYATALNREVALLARLEQRAGLTECRVLESLTVSKPTRRALADAIAELQENAGADLVTFQVTGATPVRRWLPTLGFAPAPHHITPCARDLTSARELGSGRAWIMTAGDFHTT
jgi:GNAT superfamily N-acetyltransferase